MDVYVMYKVSKHCARIPKSLCVPCQDALMMQWAGMCSEPFSIFSHIIHLTCRMPEAPVYGFYVLWLNVRRREYSDI